MDWQTEGLTWGDCGTQLGHLRLRWDKHAPEHVWLGIDSKWDDTMVATKIDELVAALTALRDRRAGEANRGE